MNSYKNRSLLQSFKNAFKGIWFCIKSERNMRIHTVVVAYLLFFSPFLEVSRSEYALLFAVIALVISTEMMNTSVEKLSDFTCNKRDRRIGVVKDVAAGAVFVSSIIAVIVGFIILYKPELLIDLVIIIFSNVFYIIVLGLSIVFALIFILFGPMGIKVWFHNRKHKKK